MKKLAKIVRTNFFRNLEIKQKLAGTQEIFSQINQMNPNKIASNVAL